MKGKRKTGLQRRILAVSVILALLIVVGGTFAWFTSYDEVVNKLTAVNNYGVSITEDFTAPENWLPGQEVNKDVQAVNTGNVDALVRMAISSSMNLRGYYDSYEWLTYNELRASGEQDFTSLFEALKEAVTTGGKELTLYTQEEISMIRGNGYLLYEENHPVDRDCSGNYTPEKSGLYLFDGGSGEDAIAEGYEETLLFRYEPESYLGGYLYITAADADTLFGGSHTEDLYVALQADGQRHIEIRYNSENHFLFNDSDLSYDFTNINDTTEPRITASSADGIKVNIYLAPNWSTNWAWNEAEKAFYYRNSLKAGVTSEKLIDSVELDGSVPGDAYEEFNYYLTVTLDSVQVTVDASGNETADAVPDTWGMQPAVTLTDSKMSAVAWTAVP